MKKELIINATSDEVEIALLEDDNLVEIHHQKTTNNFVVGDIFLGRLTKTMPGLNAAFIDIGHKKDAFLHYTDLGPKLKSLLRFAGGAINGSMPASLDNFVIEPEILKTGKIDQALGKRATVLVQVLKEPISAKGPRLTCEITLPGRYIVLSPFQNHVSVSKKLASQEERQRLQKLVESIRPKNFGIIVRTAAEGKMVADLHEEVLELMGKWEQIHEQMLRAQAPKKLLSELDKTSSILRDLLSESFSQVTVNSKELATSLRAYLQQIAPDKEGIIQYYGGNRPIFDQFGVTRQIKSSFGKTAPMPSGAYLIIERTEAMHVIDVNSGHKISSDQESSTFAVNSEAAQEIARQIRLRDIGGLIVIDFIDMKNPEHKKKIHDILVESMSTDRAQHTVLPLSKFGLMQITRERVRPEITISTAENCPTCNGTGKITASILVTDEIQRDLEFLMQANPRLRPTLHVHPYIDAFLKHGSWFRTMQWQWLFKYRKWIKIVASVDYQLPDYRFFDERNDEIKLN